MNKNECPISSGLVYCYDGNHLPHWVTDSAIYHVSFHLADSVPLAQQRRWLNERQDLLARAHTAVCPLDKEELMRLQYLFSDKVEEYLDAGYGSCILKNAEVANVVQQSLLLFNRNRYQLHAWCIMPNHVHVIFQVLNGLDVSKIVHGWKSYTAHRINKLLNRLGRLWHVDSYNHIIRSREEYFVQIRYVWKNPEKMGAKTWSWRWMCLQESNLQDNTQIGQ